MKAIKKNDIFLIVGIIIVAAIALLFVAKKRNAVDPDQVVVYVNGVETNRFPLHEDRVFVIDAGDGQTNTLEIKDGQANITKADCADHICERQGPISKNGDMMVCLPHGVMVQIESTQESDTDSTAN